MKSTKQSYSDNRFWNKIERQAKRAGRTVVERAFKLYYVAKSPDTPMPVKMLIYSALAYFILPTDAMLDPIYLDDAGALAAALIAVASYLTPGIEKKAKEEADKWIEKE
ncbi:MAG: DUF1232 domain-containing protein [Gemmatimonadetes bacterium]|nr:DUF1232 domain-containing protein [Gemmatimonadota bacterium]